jgi:hypothetical protein
VCASLLSLSPHDLRIPSLSQPQVTTDPVTTKISAAEVHDEPSKPQEVTCSTPLAPAASLSLYVGYAAGG